MRKFVMLFPILALFVLPSSAHSQTPAYEYQACSKEDSWGPTAGFACEGPDGGFSTTASFTTASSPPPPPPPPAGCTTTLTPSNSINTALNSATSGDTICLHTGNYPHLNVNGDQRRTGYVTIRPVTGENVTVAGFTGANTQYIRLENLTLDGGTVDDGAYLDHGTHHIQLVGNHITTPVWFGVTIQDGNSDVLIQNNDISAPQGTAVHLSSGNAEPEIADVTIKGNLMHNLGDAGINARHFRNLLIENNEITDLHRQPGQHTDVIRTYNGGINMTVRGNFLHDDDGIGFFIADGAVTNVVLENNVIGEMAGAFEACQIYEAHHLLMDHNTIDDGCVFNGTDAGTPNGRGPSTDVTTRDNVFASFGYSPSNVVVGFTQEDYNLIAGGNFAPGAGAHDINASPVFVGGDTYAGHHLAAGSPGKGAASDGTDMGIP